MSNSDPEIAAYEELVERLRDRCGVLTRERDGFERDALRWYRDSSAMLRERDEARAEIQRARDATVKAFDTRLGQAREVERLRPLVAKQQALIRDAEAKTADIGWRKNRLVEAIARRGLVVRWERDGTPVVETPEEVAARESQMKAAAGAQTRALAGILRRMEGELFAVPPLLPKPVDTVRQSAWTQAEEPVKPEPTAEEYYRRATTAVYGYPVRQAARWDALSPEMIARLDSALRTELRQDHPGIDTFHDADCGNPACIIWRNRPWKR